MNRIEEIEMYRNISYDLFNFMNGKINVLNICTFRVEMYDRCRESYGNLCYPNDVYINLAAIIDSWNESWSTIMTKYDFICTIIAWTIAHELYHADQLINMIKYNTDPIYKSMVEGDVERSSYDWVLNNKYSVEVIGGFRLQLGCIKCKNLPDTSNYVKANTEEFYLQIIENVILRDSDEFNKFVPIFKDKSINSILLIFNNADSVYIKYYGRYLEENVHLFSNLSYKHAGMYDRYSVYISSRICNDECTIHINCTNCISNLMNFKK